MRSRTEMMVDRLKDLQAGTPDIEASALAESGMIPVLHDQHAGIEVWRIPSPAVSAPGNHQIHSTQQGANMAAPDNRIR